MNTKKIFKLFGLYFLLASYITLILTFIVAYPQKEILITMNEYHEYWFEIGLAILACPGIVMITKNVLEEGK